MPRAASFMRCAGRQPLDVDGVTVRVSTVVAVAQNPTMPQRGLPWLEGDAESVERQQVRRADTHEWMLTMRLISCPTVRAAA